jgi:protease I
MSPDETNTALSGRRVAVMVANEGVEQVELTEPMEAIRAAGGEAVVVAPDPGGVRAFHHLDPADHFTVDKVTADVDVDDFDALVLPGGVANPDQLRTDEPAVDLIRGFIESGKPVAVICHGPWSLIEADVVKGRTVTSWPSLQTDLRNAGATWVDEQVVVDDAGPGPLITSRKPDDLDAFCSALIASMN